MREYTDDSCQFQHDLDYSDLSLTQYNAMCQRYLASRHTFPYDKQKQYAEYNAPFSHAAKAGMPTIVLIHGFSESPYSMRDLAKKFVAAGYGVQSILLPGHGSSPEELEHIKRKQWTRAVNYVCDQLEQAGKEILICGVSMGAALAVYAALQRSSIKALILLSPALDINTTKSAYFKMHNVLLALNLLDLPEQEFDFAKYDNVPPQALYQATLLIKKIWLWLKIKKIQCPVFGAVSLEDEMIDVQEVLSFFKQLGAVPNKLLCYSKTPQPSHSPHITYINSRDLANKILSYSHTSLHIAPENEMYGVQGKILEHRSLIFTKKSCSKDIYYGAVEGENLKYGRLVRLRYNPQFDLMMEDCLRFLHSNLPS